MLLPPFHGDESGKRARPTNDAGSRHLFGFASLANASTGMEEVEKKSPAGFPTGPQYREQLSTTSRHVTVPLSTDLETESRSDWQTRMC